MLLAELQLLCVQGEMALVLELWMRKTSSRPLKMFPQCRSEVVFISDFNGFNLSVTRGKKESAQRLPLINFALPDLLQQRGGGGHDQDSRCAV